MPSLQSLLPAKWQSRRFQRSQLRKMVPGWEKILDQYVEQTIDPWDIISLTNTDPVIFPKEVSLAAGTALITIFEEVKIPPHFLSIWLMWSEQRASVLFRIGHNLPELRPDIGRIFRTRMDPFERSNFPAPLRW